MTTVPPARVTPPLPGLLPKLEHAGRFASARHVPFHTHPGPELVLVTKGACTCDIAAGPRLTGRRGTLFILPGTVAHSQRNLEFARTTFVVFSAPAILFDSTPRMIQVPAGNQLETWIEQLCDLAAEHPGSGEAVTGALLYTCFARLHELEHRQQARDKLHPSLAKAAAHIEAHLTDPFRAAELARRSGVSVSHMNTLFRKHLGCSPLTYQRNRRLSRAQALLLGPYARVNEVALACGYEDANYFIRLFSRQFGLSPTSWRNQRACQPD